MKVEIEPKREGYDEQLSIEQFEGEGGALPEGPHLSGTREDSENSDESGRGGIFQLLENPYIQGVLAGVTATGIYEVIRECVIAVIF